MKNVIGRIARRIAPRVSHAASNLSHLSEKISRLEAENATMREEIDELRADSRRIAELYDYVVERA